MSAMDVFIQSFLKMLPPETAQNVDKAAKAVTQIPVLLQQVLNNQSLMMQHMGITPEVKNDRSTE